MQDMKNLFSKISCFFLMLTKSGFFKPNGHKAVAIACEPPPAYSKSCPRQGKFATTASYWKR
jgi:hypothetical protein